MTVSEIVKKIRITVWLKRAFVLSVIVLLTGISILLCTPAFLSSSVSRNFMQLQLTSILNRPVSWQHLEISWTHGLAIRELTLGTGPAPLRNASVGDATMIPTFSYANGRVRVYLNLRISGVTAELKPGPPQPPKPFREPLTAIAQTLQKVETMGWPLPFDLGVKVAVDPVTLAYSDPKTGRRATLDKCAFRLDMPSLADQPVTSELHGNLAVDGHRPEALALKAYLQRLVTSTRHIKPAAALVTVNAAFPGTTLSLSGGLHEPGGFAATANVDLAQLTAVAGPFLPPAVPKVQGELLLDLNAKADRERNLTLDFALNGSRFSISGGRPGQGRVAPLDLQLRQSILSDHKRRQVRFTGGSAAIGTLMSGSWEATVDRPSSRDRDLSVRLGPVRADLRQAAVFAAPLLSPAFPVKEISGELLLKQLSAHLSGGSNKGGISIARFGITMPRLRLATVKGGVSAEGVDLSIDQADIPFAGRLPERVDAVLSYGIRTCSVSGIRPLAAAGLHGTLQLAVSDPELNSRSPQKFAATIDLKQSLDLQRITLERMLSADTLHEQLTARILTKESGEIELSFPELKISAGALKAVTAGKELKPLPLTADMTATGIRLPAAKGAFPTVERVVCAITGGDALKLNATAGLSAGSPQLATTAGSLNMELERVLPLAAPFLPRGVSGGGITSITWNLAAPVTQQQKSGMDKNPLRAAKAAVALLDRAEITLAMGNRSIAWPLGTESIRIGELRTTQPIRLYVPGKGGNISLDGGIAFTSLSGIPGKTAQLPPQNGSFTLKGEFTDWRSLKLHQELRVTPLGLVQQADASVSRIDRLLESPDPITAVSLLQRLDAQIITDLSAEFPSRLTPLPGGVEVSGRSRIGVRINLAAGRELQVQATAAARDTGVRLRNGTIVEGMNADLLFDRTYALAKGDTAGWTPLSVSLIRPSPGVLTLPGAAELVSRVREDLRGQQRGSRKFTVQRLTTGGAAPLQLTSLEGDLLLTPEEMGLSFFQAELLGGTVRLRSLIDLKPETPSVSAACSFSNLETFLLLPPETRRQSVKGHQDTEITGELLFDAPLLTGQRELLEGVRMRLNLRKIGADTLERALFGLDPYERNEQLVAQRKMLRNGRLKNLQAGTLDGAFTLEGELQIKGVDVALPRVERIRLSELPIQKQMAKTVVSVAATRKVLDLMRADTLILGSTGKIELKRKKGE